MPFTLPPWLDVTPQFFTSALEAGARTGLAVADQNQRAQQMAEARAERQAQMQQRAEEQASRDQEFQQTHLLNVQKVAQDAAQLQQQIAHQQAQEGYQKEQESRLLNYDTGRLAVENRRAALAEKQANEPNSALDTTLLEAIDPATKQRVGLFGRSGPKTQHFIPDAVEKSLTDAQRGPLYNAEERGILKELDGLDMIAAARNPQHPKRARYEELNRQLDAVRQRRSALLGDTALAPPPAADTSSIAGSYTRDASGKLKWTPSP